MYHYIFKEWKVNLLLLTTIVVGQFCVTMWGVELGSLITAISKQEFETFGRRILTLLGLVILWCIQVYLETYLLTMSIQRMDIQIRKELANRFVSSSYEVMNDGSSESYTSWLVNDVQLINQYGFGNLEMMVNQFVGILFSMVAIVYYHYSIMISILVGSFVMYVVPRLFKSSLNRQMEKVSRGNDEFTIRVSDVLKGYPDLFNSGNTAYLQKEIFQASIEVAKVKIGYGNKAGRMSAATNATSLLSQVCIICQTGYLFMLGLVPLGAVTASQYLSASLFSALTGFTQNWIELSTVQPIFQKFERITQISKGEKRSLPQLKSNILITKNGEEPIEVMQFDKGKKYAIIGSSGSGKTTVLRTLLNQSTQLRGFWDGMSYTNLAAQTFSEQIAYIPQNPHIFSKSILENIVFDREYDSKTLEKVLEVLDLNEWLDALPQGLETILDENGKNISGGQRQRIAIARGLMQEKAILLMDEATSAVQKELAKDIEQWILSQLDWTVIIVTHHLSSSLLPLFDNVYDVEGMPWKME